MGSGGLSFCTWSQDLFVASPLQTGSCVTHELKGQAEDILCASQELCVYLSLSHSFLLVSNFASSAGGLPKENPYEDVDLKNRRAGRKSQQLSENSLDSLHRMWSPQDRKYNHPPMQVMQLWPRQSGPVPKLLLTLLSWLAVGRGLCLRRGLCTQDLLPC